MSNTMKGAGFTPGPWRVGSDFYGIGATSRTSVDIITHDQTGRAEPDYTVLIADVNCNGHVVTDPKEQDANARLIAAAPELYEVLRYAIEPFLEMPVKQENMSPPLWDWFCRARAVIASVSGETIPDFEERAEQLRHSHASVTQDMGRIAGEVAREVATGLPDPAAAVNSRRCPMEEE